MFIFKTSPTLSYTWSDKLPGLNIQPVDGGWYQSAVGPFEVHDLSREQSFTKDSLELLAELSIGEHSAALSWLNKFGPWSYDEPWKHTPTTPTGWNVPPVPHLGGVLPSAWRAETLQLRRARWLHKYLLNDIEEERRCSELLDAGKAPGGYPGAVVLCDQSSGQTGVAAGQLYINILWPNEHTVPELPWGSIMNQIRTGMRVTELGQEACLWMRLAWMINDGLNRFQSKASVRFDKEYHGILEDPSGDCDSLGAAAWKCLRAEVLNELPPGRCQSITCNRIIRRTRQSKRFCNNTCSTRERRRKMREEGIK